MRERERAEWVARAIEDLLDGAAPGPVPAGLDQGDLQSLIALAKARLEGARLAARAGLQYEGQVWHDVLLRLTPRAAPAVRPSLGEASLQGVQPSDVDFELLDSEVDDLFQIMNMRRQMAEEIASQAEAHRAEVWQRVQSRIKSSAAREARFVSGQQPSDDEANPVVGPSNEVNDPPEDAVFEAVRARRAFSVAAQQAAAGSQERVWGRVVAAVTAAPAAAPREPTFAGAHTHFWPLLATLAAGVAILAAALGPLPTSGFAEHPAARFVGLLAEFVGVSESGPPPPAPAPGDLAGGISVTAEQAANLMGLPVREPATLPEGFHLTSSLFFSEPITAERPGLFVLTYAANEGSAALAISQEEASGGDLGTGANSATSVTLAGGVPATYIQGAWQPDAGGFTWENAGSQSLLFDRDGVRTIINYSGPAVDASVLVAIGENMAPAPR